MSDLYLKEYLKNEFAPKKRKKASCIIYQPPV